MIKAKLCMHRVSGMHMRRSEVKKGQDKTSALNVYRMLNTCASESKQSFINHIDSLYLGISRGHGTELKNKNEYTKCGTHIIRSYYPLIVEEITVQRLSARSSLLLKCASLEKRKWFRVFRV